METASRPISDATILATAMGWKIYASPDFLSVYSNVKGRPDQFFILGGQGLVADAQQFLVLLGNLPVLLIH